MLYMWGREYLWWGLGRLLEGCEGLIGFVKSCRHASSEGPVVSTGYVGVVPRRSGLHSISKTVEDDDRDRR